MTEFIEPKDLKEACGLLARDQWANKVISGGTALVLMMRQGLVAPAKLVSIARIAGLEGIRVEDSRLWIGARTTHATIADSTEIRTWIPSLSEACSRVGNVRVRNVGTIGGNLAEADYASDPPTVLIGLDALCEISGPRGSRQLPVADLVTGFYTTSLDSGEIITGISVPLEPNRVYAYERFVSRSWVDRPCAGVAVTARFEGQIVDQLSVAVGAVSAVSRRFDEVTSAAVGGALDDHARREIATAIAEAIDPIEDGRGSAWYRRRVTSTLVRRALERIGG